MQAFLNNSLLLTRPTLGNKEFASIIQSSLKNIKIVHGSLFEIEYKTLKEKSFNSPAVIFTSKNGVESVKEIKFNPNCTAFCVGDSTAKAAELAGFQVKSAEGNVWDLLKLIKENFSSLSGEIYYFRGKDIAFDIFLHLKNLEYQIKEIICYCATPVMLDKGIVSDIKKSLIGAAVFFSKRSAEYFCKSIDFLPEGFAVFCISNDVSKVIETNFPETQIKYFIAESPNISSMRKLIVAAY